MADAAGLYYELHGPADAPTLILSSGLGGSASYWAPNLAALAAEHRIVIYDHRGTGRSDHALPAAVTVEQFADDMLALMNALAIERATIVGHAAGGVAGLSLALKAPERLDRLVVVNGWAAPDPSFLRCFDARLALLRDSGPEAYLRAQPIFLYPANWISGHHATLEAELPHQLAHFAGRESYEKRIAALAAFDIADRLIAITTPTLVIAARDDMLVPSRAGEALAAGLPHTALGMLDFGGHAVNITRPDSFGALLLEWLASDFPE